MGASPKEPPARAPRTPTATSTRRSGHTLIGSSQATAQTAPVQAWTGRASQTTCARSSLSTALVRPPSPRRATRPSSGATPPLSDGSHHAAHGASQASGEQRLRLVTRAQRARMVDQRRREAAAAMRRCRLARQQGRRQAFAAASAASSTTALVDTPPECTPCWVDRFHVSHALVYVGGLVGCKHCASIASTPRASALTSRCPGTASKGGRHRISILMRGSRPAPWTDWPDRQADPGANRRVWKLHKVGEVWIFPGIGHADPN